MRTSRRSAYVLVSAPLLCLCSACGGGGLGGELTVRPIATPLPVSDGVILRIPAEGGFSLALSDSRREPGLGGAAEADSSASPDGQAAARVEVRGEGLATASFQVGHRVDNESQTQRELEVLVRCILELEAHAEPASPLDAGVVSLALYARDGRNRLIREVPLASFDTSGGAVRQRDEREVRFTLPLGPGESLTTYLGGGVTAETPPEHAARCTLRVEELVMEFRATSAAPLAPAAP